MYMSQIFKFILTFLVITFYTRRRYKGIVESELKKRKIHQKNINGPIYILNIGIVIKFYIFSILHIVKDHTSYSKS